MTDRDRPASTWAAGAVGLLVSGGFAAAWWWLVERPVCEETGMFACSGPALVMYAVGVPVGYVVWSLGLRAARVALPWLAPWVVLGALVVLVPMTDAVDPPLAVWPFVVAALCALWAKVPDAHPGPARGGA